jgi:lipoyl(octanoyl) transferase
MKHFDVVSLGVVPYSEGLELQRRSVELRKCSAIPNTFLLLEHTPVITLGRNARAENIVGSREQLAKADIEIFECDRGGDVTYHGPGQLVGYLIFDLRSFRDENGVRKTMWPVDFVRHVEEGLIISCAELGIRAGRVKGLTGVWVDAENPERRRKIAAIGIHVSRGVTSHGFALNVSTDLTAFDLIVPCGIVNCAVTSVERELGKKIKMKDVAKTIAKAFGEIFAQEVRWARSLPTGPANQDIPLRKPDEFEELRRIPKRANA